MERDRAWGRAMEGSWEGDERTPRAKRGASPGGAQGERGGEERSGDKVRQPSPAGRRGARYPEGRGEGGGGGRRTGPGEPSLRPRPPRRGTHPRSGSRCSPWREASGAGPSPTRGGRGGSSGSRAAAPASLQHRGCLRSAPLPPPLSIPPRGSRRRRRCRPPPGSPAPALLAAGEGVARGLAAPSASPQPGIRRRTPGALRRAPSGAVCGPRAAPSACLSPAPRGAPRGSRLGSRPGAGGAPESAHRASQEPRKETRAHPSVLVD